jgi:hypothetical protein
LTTSVNEPVSEEEIFNLTSIIADIYNVNDTDIFIEVIYMATGTIELNITNDDATIEDVLDNLEESLSQILGVPTADIALEYDESTGKLIF